MHDVTSVKCKKKDNILSKKLIDYQDQKESQVLIATKNAFTLTTAVSTSQVPTQFLCRTKL